MGLIHTECTRLVQSVEPRLAWVWAEHSDAHRTSCAKKFLRSNKSSSFFGEVQESFWMRTARELSDIALKYGTRIFHVTKFFFFMRNNQPLIHTKQKMSTAYSQTRWLFTKNVAHFSQNAAPKFKECCTLYAECCTYFAECCATDFNFHQCNQWVSENF